MTDAIHHRGHGGHEGSDGSCPAVLRVLRGRHSCCVASCVDRRTACAQMTGAPAAGYKREPGMTGVDRAGAAARDRLRSESRSARAARYAARRRGGPRRCALATTSASAPSSCVFAYYDCPMLCTQVINGLASALGVLSLEPGKDFEIVTVSFDPRDTPATATAKKAVYLRALQAAGRRGRVALSHGRRGIDRAADQGRRLPLRLGRADASSSRTRPA